MNNPVKRCYVLMQKYRDEKDNWQMYRPVVFLDLDAALRYSMMQLLENSGYTVEEVNEMLMDDYTDPIKSEDGNYESQIHWGFLND